MTLGRRFRQRSGAGASRTLLVLALLICTLFVSGSRAAVLAQESTPAAAAACVAPVVPEGTPEPMEGMTGEDMASPAAEPEASPAAGEELPATPVPPSGTLIEDQAVIDAATAVVSNIAACLNEGNYLGALAQTTENFRLSQFGSANIYTVAAILEEFGFTLNIVEILGVYDLGDGKVAVDYQTLEGQQVIRTLDVLVQVDGVWTLDATYDLPAETSQDSQTIGVKFGTADNEFIFEISPTEFAAQPATIFQATNVGKIEHEFVLVQVPEGFDPASFTGAEGEPPEGVTFIGALYLLPGQTGQMLIEGLQPGNYVAYCFIPTEDGTTHAEHGMFAPITVTEPVDLGVPDVVGTPAS